MIDAALAALGMPVPDSALAKQARELIADVGWPWLVNHSVRSYAWAVELARHDDLRFDPEILYVSAALHDLGLVPAYDIGGGYEVDGAIAAERLRREAGEPRSEPAPSTTSSRSTTTKPWRPAPRPRSCSSGTRPAST